MILSLISLSSWLQKALARHEQPKTNHQAISEAEEAPAVTDLRQSEPASAHAAGSVTSRPTRTHEENHDLAYMLMHYDFFPTKGKRVITAWVASEAGQQF
jgi:hypothetical protein